jgi:hypothetical protein
MAEMWKMRDPEIIKHWIFESLYHSIGLTDWEWLVLVSIDKQFHSKGFISQRQQKILERIYVERTK